MTCIVGIVHSGKVWIGGDSAATCDDDRMTQVLLSPPKVFTVGEFIFGCAGSVRSLQVLRYQLTVPERKERQDLDSYMACDFIDAVRLAMADGGCIHVENGVESIQLEFLVGYQGRLFSVQGDLQVSETMNDFHACGSGDLVALGAMHALNGTAQPKRKLLKALEAASTFTAAVRAPFVVLSA